MAFKSLYFLLIIVTVDVLLVTRDVASSRVTRQKRSDDGGPLETVVEQLVSAGRLPQRQGGCAGDQDK